MTQIYADGVLVYDSRLPDYGLLSLKLDTGIDKGGAAYIQMPPGHPAFDSFVSYRTVVEIYRNGELLFRGRALYPSDDFRHCRTVTCEGERCFLRDAVIRPYAYQDTPAAVFTAVIGEYNAQVDVFKRFAVGTVTVSDPGGIISLAADSAENSDTVIEHLVERCGGYLVFSSDGNGGRVISWYADVGSGSTQTVEFGENLLDFASTDENTDLATVIVPFGAKDENTGLRVTIESVNGGLDYIQDEDAVALRGRIAKTVTWDDITTPAALLTKAYQMLSQSKQMVTSLTLTAVDLSVLDRSIDSFRIGDLIRVRSAPHGVDAWFQLTARSFDLLHPEADRITLGKTITTLSGSAASAQKQSAADVQRVETRITEDYGRISRRAVFTLGAASSSISSGDDLNEYKTPGVYAVPSDDVSVSLVNKSPSNAAGTLRVYNATGGSSNSGPNVSMMQEYRSVQATEPVYRRSLRTDAVGAWTYSSWTQ